MCGLAGFERRLYKTDLKKIEPVLKHRGPDSTGFFQDEYYSFIHWRLSIIDLDERANQPFRFKNLVLVYNGEVYNYREIAILLERQGYHFETQSDTEVLIKAFHCWGVSAVHKLIGMFAFSLYDLNTQEIFLFRDRLGIKPLYYSISNGLAFGSEMKIFKSIDLTLTIDPYALHQFFRFGYVPGTRTIFNEVKKLTPGQYLHFKSGVAQCKTYWNIPKPQVTEGIISQDIKLELEKLLISSFNYRLVADVPVGVLLSGGIDSSLLATLLQHHSGHKIKTFTIGFEDPAFDETKYARQIADRLQTEHVELNLDINRARNLFDNFFEIFDEPFSDTSGIPMTIVSQLAKENGIKVVLSADGADEFFGGYEHYQRINQWISNLNAIPGVFTKGFAGLTKTLFPPNLRSTFVFNNLEHRLNRLEELLITRDDISIFESSIANQTNQSISRLTQTSLQPMPLLSSISGQPQEKMMYWDAHYYLPDDLLMKVDRATMFTSIEGREPFLDHRLVEFAQRLPLESKIAERKGKKILRSILFKYHPSELFDRPKKGFSIPIFKWFSEKFDHYFDDFLQEDRILRTGLLDPKVVKAELGKYRYYKQKGRDYNIEKMWRLLCFMMWHERWMN